jgi:hypothetical protein
MSFPKFDYCIVCEILRLELGGKWILLGFHGLAPNVELTIADPNRMIGLSLLAGCPPVPDTSVRYEYVALVTRPDGVGIYQTPSLKMVTAQNRRLNFPIGFSIAPPILTGRYSIQMTVNGEVALDTSFTIRSPAPPDVNRSVPAPGAPN